MTTLTQALHHRHEGELEADQFEAVYSDLARVLGLPNALAAYLVWKELEAIRPGSAFTVDDEGATPVPVPQEWLPEAITEGGPLLVVVTGPPDVRLTEAGYRVWGWDVEPHVHIGSIPPMPVQLTSGDVVQVEAELLVTLARRGEVVKVMWPSDTVFALLWLPDVMTAWHIEADMAVAAMTEPECRSYLRGWPLHESAVRRLDGTGQRDAIARILLLTQVRRCEWLEGCRMHSTTTAPGSPLTLASEIGRETCRDLDQALGSHEEPPCTTRILSADEDDAHGVREDSKEMKDRPLYPPRVDPAFIAEGRAALEGTPLPKGLKAFAEALLDQGDVGLAAAELGITPSTGRKRLQRVLAALNKR